MQISFKNYGCHNELTVNFIKGLNLLKGKSGSGKSTILKSIVWAFYGGKNFYGKSPSRSLTLDYNNLRIIRNRGKKVTLIKGDQKYIGEEADALILKLLNLPSDEDTWHATSYIEQNMPSLLIGGLTNEKKVELLNKILFTDNPDEYIKKIDEEKKTQTKLIKNLEERYESKKLELEQDFPDVSKDDIMSSEEFDNFKKEMKHLQSLIENDKKNREKYKLLNEQKSQYEKDIFDINSIDKTINRLQEKLKKAIYYEENIDRYNLIQKSLKQLNIKNIKFTLDEVKKFKETEELRLLYSKKCNEYSAEWIDKTKKEMNDIIEFFNKYEYEIKQSNLMKCELKELIANRDEKMKKLNNLGLDELLEKYADISEEDTDEIEVLDEIEKLKNKISECKKYNKISTEVDNIKKEIDSYNITDFNYTTDQIKKFIQDFDDIKKYKNKCEEYTEQWLEMKKSKTHKLHEKYIKIEADIPKYNDFKKKYENALNNKKVHETRISHINSELKKLQIQNIDINNITELELEVEKLGYLVNILKCPHCNKSVIYDGNILKEAHGDVVSRDLYNEKTKELNQLKEKYNKNQKNIEIRDSKLNEIEKLNEKIKQCNEDIDKYSKKLNELEKYKDLSKKDLLRKIEELNNIKILKEPPINLNTCKNMLKCLELKDRLNKITLPEYPGDIDELQNELNNKTNLFNKLRKNKKLLAEIDKLTLEKKHLETSIDDLNKNIETLKEKLSNCKEYKGKISKEEAIKRSRELSDVVFIEKSPLDLDECNNIIEYINLNEELNKIGNLEYVGKSSDIKNKIDDYINKKNISIYKSKEIKRINDDIQNIKLLDNLDEIISKYENMKKRKGKISIAIKYSERKTTLDELYNNLIKEQKILNNIIKLEEKMKQILYTYINDTLEVLNAKIDDIIQRIFDNEMIVEIKTIKEDKNNTRRFHLDINYKGMHYNDVKYLSGGEQSRISFAITVALNDLLNNTDILLLDECFSSLDFSNRSKCVDILKELTDKIIICVNHEDVEGLYQNVVAL